MTKSNTAGINHLDARMSSKLDGGVVVSGAQEMVHQHAVKSFLAPLRGQR